MDFSQLDILPELFETEFLKRIPEDVIKYSEMHEAERKFVNGLIRLAKPKKILEIGVSGGAGSAVILNAISDMSESHLYSFDISEKWYMDTSKDVGFVPGVMWPEGNGQWSLYTGRDISECISEFEDKFDFVIIDTAHVHPVESLNFLCVLPYLSDDAVVVFHDLALYMRYSDRFGDFPMVSLANKLAYDTIVGVKLEPEDKDYLNYSNGVPSIGAIQISDDTRKYIDNTFNMLYFPWAGFSFVADYIFDVANLIKRHYSEKLYKKLCNAIAINVRLVFNDFKYQPWNKATIKDILNTDKFIFYGAGQVCKKVLNFVKQYESKLPSYILDIDTSQKEIIGIPIKCPDFSNSIEVMDDVVYVITIGKQSVYEEVRAKILACNKSAKVYSYKDLYRALIYEKLVEAGAEDSIE